MRPLVLYFLLIFFAFSFKGNGFALAEEQAKTCTPLAILFSEVICTETLNQDMPAETIMGIDKAASGQNGKPAAEALRSEIWRRALIYKYGADALDIDDTELTNFRQIFKTETDRSYEEDKLAAALLEAYLDSNLYGEPYRSQMSRLLEATKISIASFEKKKEHESSIPAHMQFIGAEVEKAVANQMLRRWKEDKLLFQEYGGRLVRLPGRLLPLDAYREFYNYLLNEGALEITDPAYHDIFAHIDAGSDLQYLPQDDPLYKNYFTDASWQFRITADNDRLVILENWLKSLPVKEGTKNP